MAHPDPLPHKTDTDSDILEKITDNLGGDAKWIDSLQSKKALAAKSILGKLSELEARRDAEPIDSSKSYSEGEIVYAEGASWRVAAGGANAGDLPSTHPDKFTVLSSNSALLGYTHKTETAFNEIRSKNIVGELNSGNLISGLSGDHTLIIGNNVTSIGGYANMFQTQTVGALVIPDSVTSIGSYAFYANGITSLDMGNRVTTTSLSSFSGCSSLTSITLSNSLVTIGDSCFSNCSNITGSLIIPDSVTTISGSAFTGCSGFTGDLTIPNSVTTILGGAFRGCTGFTGSLTIPDSVTTIGSAAFYCCAGFTGDLTIGDSVTSIGSNAFYCCTGLTGDLTIPDSVTTIGNFAFYQCTGLTNVNCHVTRTIMNSTGAFADTGITTLHAEAGKGWTAGADTIGGKALTVIIDL